MEAPGEDEIEDPQPDREESGRISLRSEKGGKKKGDFREVCMGQVQNEGDGRNQGGSRRKNRKTQYLSESPGERKRLHLHADFQMKGRGGSVQYEGKRRAGHTSRCHSMIPIG